MLGEAADLQLEGLNPDAGQACQPDRARRRRIEVDDASSDERAAIVDTADDGAAGCDYRYLEVRSEPRRAMGTSPFRRRESLAVGSAPATLPSIPGSDTGLTSEGGVSRNDRPDQADGEGNGRDISAIEQRAALQKKGPAEAGPSWSDVNGRSGGDRRGQFEEFVELIRGKRYLLGER